MLRQYEVQGQYGYWVVMEYHTDDDGNDTNRCVYSTISPIPTRKLAERVAGALNDAYQHGREDV